MRKKGLGVIASLVLVMAMGIISVAAPSKTVTGIVDAVKSWDANQKEVSVSIVELQDEYKDAPDDLDKATLKDVLGDYYKADYKVWDIVGLKANGNEDDIEFPVTIRTSISEVEDGTDVVVLQWDGSEWVVVDSETGAGYVELVVDDLGPIAFVTDMAGVSSTSPVTGDVVPVMAVIMLAATAGVVVLSKKEFAK